MNKLTELIKKFGERYWNEVLSRGKYSTSVDLFDEFAKESEQADYQYFEEMCPGLWDGVWQYLGEKLKNT